MSDTVYVTARGDRYHARPDCSGITGPHRTALPQCYEVTSLRPSRLPRRANAGRACGAWPAVATERDRAVLPPQARPA
jgi:hypothetical protein